jgi:hypothetical protein
MKAMAAVTLSNENGPSRSCLCHEPWPAASGAQRPACAPPRPGSPNADHHLGADRP